MKNADVKFCHYRLEFTDEVLGRFGSRYFGKGEARKHLCNWARTRTLIPHSKLSLSFPDSQLICANEVFPEAALADPVADLEVWDEWRTGLRRFPHPGIYTRLGIFHQERKTSATSSIGVLGEIMAGLLTQSFIAPLVTVRPIHHWPDFILLTQTGNYAFVESKASVDFDGSQEGVWGISEELLGEGLVDAVQELNADPSVQVWLAFSQVTSVQPLQVQLVMVETQAPLTRQALFPKRIPDAVLDGLAERVLDLSAAELEPEMEELFESPGAIPKRDLTRRLWGQLRERALKNTERVLKPGVPDELYGEALQSIRERIRSWKPREIRREVVEGRRFIEAKQIAATGRFASLRGPESADQKLFLADLPPELLQELTAQWRPDWSKANQPWGRMKNIDLWRCSSAVLALGPEILTGRDVSNKA